MKRIIVGLLIFGATSTLRPVRVYHTVDPIYVNHNTSSVTVLPPRQSFGSQMGEAVGQGIADGIREYKRAREVRQAHQRQIELENYRQEQLCQQRLREQAHQKRLQEIAHQQRLEELSRQKQLHEELLQQQYFQEQALQERLKKERDMNIMFAFRIFIILLASSLFVFVIIRKKGTQST